MRIVVTANGTDLDAPASPVFGRCPVYIFVDTESLEFESVENPAIAAAGGAGIQAAQFIVERGAQAVVSGHMGPNASNVLQAAAVPVYLLEGGTVREAVESFKAGRLGTAAGTNVQAGTGMGQGMGLGRGMGQGRGMGRGMGQGRGMGRGMGQGRGMGLGRQATVPPTPPTPPPLPASAASHEEIAALQDMVTELRKQLAKVMNHIDRIEKEK